MVTLKHDDKLQDGSECAFQVEVFRLVYSKPYPALISCPRTDPLMGHLTFFVTYVKWLSFDPFLHFIFQCALLYTTVYGQRRIRVSTLSLPCTTLLSNLFRSAVVDTQFACFLKQGLLWILYCESTFFSWLVREHLLFQLFSLFHFITLYDRRILMNVYHLYNLTCSGERNPFQSTSTSQGTSDKPLHQHPAFISQILCYSFVSWTTYPSRGA